MIDAQVGTLRVVALEHANVEVPLLTLAVRGGHLHAPGDLHQVPHLHEHLAMRGRDGEVQADADEVEQRGAIFNAHTLNEWTQFEARTPRAALADAARVLASAAFAPVRWRDEHVAVEAKVVTAELQQRQSTLRHHLTYRLKRSTVGRAAGAISPKQQLDSLERITLEDLLAFRTAFMTADNAVLLLLTSRPEADLAVATRALSDLDLPSGEPAGWARANPEPHNGWELVRVNARQHAAGVGFRSVPFGDPRYGTLALALGLLAFGTGARLYRDAILTRGIAYSIDTHMDYGATYGFGSFMAITAAREHSDLFLDLLARHIDDIAHNGPSLQEWDRAKERYFVHLALAQEHPVTASSWHLRSLLYRGRPFDFRSLREQLQELESGDMLPVWREVLAPERRSAAVLEGAA